MKELGLSFNQKWNTDNTLATEVTVEDQVRVCVWKHSVLTHETDKTSLLESYTVLTFTYSWLRG